MSRFYRRTKPDFRDNLGAGLLAAGLAAGVAVASFYLARLFLAREPLEPIAPESPRKDALHPDPDTALFPTEEDQG